ncbi:MAG: acylneuraminate cytidylyltransferase family protein [Anaerolineae bacterium]|nr:acylneuraminate cytidylyltransferase family protein [Anaerolineae bacterium]
MNPKILAIIPARGGSKGVSQKNIREIGGKPLIQYAIDAALAIKADLHRIIVSTDDSRIAEVAAQCGAEVPFLRPAELAQDTTPMIPVLQHVVRFVEQQEGAAVDWVLLLQPTALFRTSQDLQQAIHLGLQGGCDSVISVVQVFSTHPILMKKIVDDCLVPFSIEEKEGTRRQDYAPPAYMRNGAIYFSRRDNIMKHNSIWGSRIRPYIMPEERSVNIDSLMDFRLAQLMMEDKDNG